MALATPTKAQAAPALAARCREHPERTDLWRCIACKSVYCDECVKVRDVGGTRFQVCKACGDRCEDVRAAEAEEARQESFFELLPGAFSYPIRGVGIAFLVMATIFFGLLKVLSFSLLGKIMGVLGAGYLAAWLFKIVNDTAMGRREFSEWPDVTDIVNDVCEPLRAVGVTFLLSFGPALASLAAGWLWHPFFFALAVVLAAAGAAYYPMAILATAIGTTLAYHPGEICGSILRLLGPYLTAYAVFVAVGLVLGLGTQTLEAGFPILGAVVAYGASIYLAIVEARILGLLYWTGKERLGWLT